MLESLGVVSQAVSRFVRSRPRRLRWEREDEPVERKLRMPSGVEELT
jgi:hypothetical protein